MRLGPCLLFEGRPLQGAHPKLPDFCSAPAAGFYAAVDKRTGYKNLDHTRYFAHGFVTCPYHGADEVIDSAFKINHHCASITAEELDVSFYAEGVKPVLVKCEWSEPLTLGKLIPKKLAVPLMLEQELPCWRWSSRAERWDVMRPYLLGEPHGSRSSLFVDQETALAMKRAYFTKRLNAVARRGGLGSTG